MGWLEAGVIRFGRAESQWVLIKVNESNSRERWRRGTVEVSAGPWRGTCRVWFDFGELRQFADDIDKLHRTLEGRVEFRPIEPYLEFNLAGDGKGHISVDGKAGDMNFDGSYVAFVFELDQTELPDIVKSLRIADPD
ncbi:MAG: hypothetical protein JNL62_09570 [Bryobacterales bacterium]|nr:hypothetical protein [Bryobacterales bacterium]